MAQLHEIMKLYNTRIIENATVSALIPGGLHHAKLVDELAIRPYATIEVNETAREYISGGQALADYEVTILVYNKQKVETAGNTQLLLEKLFAPNSDFVIYTQPIMSSLEMSGMIEEDEKTIDGLDVLQSKNKWKIKVLEPFQVAPKEKI